MFVRSVLRRSTDSVIRVGGIEGKASWNPVARKDIAALRHEVSAMFVAPSAAGAGAVEPTQTALGHVRWLLQKERLGQDIFLSSAPGPLKRSLVNLYCALAGRVQSYVCLSRDTTDSDLILRREIKGN